MKAFGFWEDLTVSINDEPRLIAVRFYYTPPIKGARDKFGPLEPDDEESIEITEARLDNNPIQLTKEQEKEAFKALESKLGLTV